VYANGREKQPYDAELAAQLESTDLMVSAPPLLSQKVMFQIGVRETAKGETRNDVRETAKRKPA